MVKRGRPSKFTKVLGESICARLAAGESLRSICRGKDMPDEATVRAWALENPEFSPHYARARELGYAALAEDILEIADDKEGDAQRDRLRVDTRKWLLSKVLPKIYGDKVEHTGKDGGPISLEALIVGSYEKPQ